MFNNSLTRAVTLLSLPLCFMANAHDMVPASTQNQAILFTNATVHTVTNGVMLDSDVLIADGKVIAVTQNLDADKAPATASTTQAKNDYNENTSTQV